MKDHNIGGGCLTREKLFFFSGEAKWPDAEADDRLPSTWMEYVVKKYLSYALTLRHTPSCSDTDHYVRGNTAKRFDDRHAYSSIDTNPGSVSKYGGQQNITRSSIIAKSA